MGPVDTEVATTFGKISLKFGNFWQNLVRFGNIGQHLATFGNADEHFANLEVQFPVHVDLEEFAYCIYLLSNLALH